MKNTIIYYYYFIQYYIECIFAVKNAKNPLEKTTYSFMKDALLMHHKCGQKYDKIYYNKTDKIFFYNIFYQNFD